MKHKQSLLCGRTRKRTRQKFFLFPNLSHQQRKYLYVFHPKTILILGVGKKTHTSNSFLDILSEETIILRFSCFNSEKQKCFLKLQFFCFKKGTKTIKKKKK